MGQNNVVFDKSSYPIFNLVFYLNHIKTQNPKFSSNETKLNYSLNLDRL